MTPTNDARALHSILEIVGHSTSAAPVAAWEGALDAAWGTVEFTRRHSEVTSLLVGTLRHIATLPERSRDRYERYAFPWWTAVVAPQNNWSQGSNMQAIVDPGALDQLGALADVIEARLAGTLAVVEEANLDGLRQSCQEWIDGIEGDSELAHALRLNLLQDLKHVQWLIDNATLFGVGRVVAAGEQVVGNIVTIGQTLPPARYGPWLARGRRLIQALVVIGGLSQGIDTSFALAEGATSFFGELANGSSSEPSAPGLNETPPSQPDTEA